MNREFKFRAWDKIEHRMNTVQGISWHDAIVTFWYADSWGPDAWTSGKEKDMKDVVLMQSTGLLDADAKEIWEGDVVKNIHTNRIGKVTWVSGAFNIQELNYGDFDTVLPICGIGERVIGNAHEGLE